MVLQGFADDSGSGKGTGQGNVYVLAGFISTAPDWEAFSDAFNDTCAQDPKTPKFKMSRAYRMKGPYQWKSEEQRDARIRELVRLVMQHSRYRVDVVLTRPNYERIVRGKLPPKIDDPYFICFYHVILSTAHLLNKLKLNMDTVDWVFDEQGHIGIEAVRWYYWVKQNVPDEVAMRMGSTPIFRSDDNVLPLKSADMLAWQIRRHLNEEQRLGIPPNDNLDAFLGKYGVSSHVPPEHLEALVTSGGINLKSDSVFFLPKEVA